jgi:hypothetical protein
MSSRTFLALDAVHAALQALSALPHSDERQRISGVARACERALKLWQHRAPEDHEREALMQQILGIHVAVSRLQRAESS